MPAKACAVRVWIGQKKSVTVSDSRERQTGKMSVWRIAKERKRADKAVDGARRCGPGGRPMKKGRSVASMYE